MFGLADVQGAFRAMARIADASGATMQIDPACKVPYADLKTRRVVLPPLKTTVKAHDLTMWKAYGYHEAGHLDKALSDMLPFMVENKLGTDCLLGRLLNIGEDIRNERNKHGLYVGRDKALDYCQAWHCKDGAKQVADAGFDKLDPEMQIFTNALVLAYVYRGLTFQPSLALASTKWDGVCDVSAYHRLMPSMEFVTAQDVYDWAIEFLEASGKSEEEAREEAEEAYAKAQEGGDEEGEGGGKSESSELGDDGDGKPADSIISYKDLLMDDHKEKEGSEPSSCRVQINYDHEWSDDFEPSGPMREYVLDTSERGHTYQAVMENYSHASKLSGKVKRLFQAASQRQKLGSQREGRLDRRNLYRVPTGSREIFYTNTTRLDPRDTALYILVDGSGSMCYGYSGGSKYSVAGGAAAALVDSLSPIHMPIKVAIFSDCYNGSMHGIVKDWKQKATPDSVAGAFEDFKEKGFMRNNDDGSSILHSAKDLAAQSAKRKILIVLSDGQPASSGEGDAYAWTHKVIQSVSSQIDCYGIGIEDSTVSELYPESTVLKNASELDACILGVVKSKLL